MTSSATLIASDETLNKVKAFFDERGTQDIAEIQVTDRNGLVSDYLVQGEIVSG